VSRQGKKAKLEKRNLMTSSDERRATNDGRRAAGGGRRAAGGGRKKNFVFFRGETAPLPRAIDVWCPGRVCASRRSATAAAAI
jgi:hypothetical protein